MRNLTLIGVFLVVLGIAGLIVQNVSFTENKKVVDFGPLQIRADEQHNVPIPTVAGIVAVIAGPGNDLCFAPLHVTKPGKVRYQTGE
jgi:hypothetical protein